MTIVSPEWRGSGDGQESRKCYGDEREHVVGGPKLCQLAEGGSYI